MELFMALASRSPVQIGDLVEFQDNEDDPIFHDSTGTQPPILRGLVEDIRSPRSFARWRRRNDAGLIAFIRSADGMHEVNVLECRVVMKHVGQMIDIQQLELPPTEGT